MRSVDGAALIEAVEAHGSSRSVRASAITQRHLHWIPLVLKLLALLLPDGAKLEIECRSIDSLDPAFCVGFPLLCFDTPRCRSTCERHRAIQKYRFSSVKVRKQVFPLSLLSFLSFACGSFSS